MKKMISTQHPLVKHCALLRTDKAYRVEKQCALISGVKLLTDIASERPLKTLFIQQGATLSSLPQAEDYVEVSCEVLKKITALPHPESLAAEVPFPPTADLSRVQ